MVEPITNVRSPALVLPFDNIDTDQIIPARYLTTTERSGLGKHAFVDWRTRPDSPLSDPRAADCAILVAGDNFGCGSSREHAAWALLDMGIRVVISTQVADIFCANAVKNGLLPVVVNAGFHRHLVANPWREVTVDLQAQTCSGDDGIECTFDIDAFSRQCLLKGMDQLDYLLSRETAIAAWEEVDR